MTSQRKKRILVIQPQYHDLSHDANDLVEQMLVALPKTEFETTSLFLQGAPTTPVPSNADHVAYLDLPDQSLRGLRLKLRRTLYAFCRERQFDAVICNRYKPVLLMMQINRWLRIPLCIGISHGIGEYKTLRRRWLARWHINAQWHFVGVSSTVTDYLIAQNCGFTPDNTTTINNAIDIPATEKTFLARAEARSDLGITDDTCLIGTIGRLVRVKGHDRLIKAFALIHQQFPKARLLIIGGGKEEEALRATIRSLGLEEKVFLPGFRTRAARFVPAFDIWVMPSFSEGLPRALLEGMCAHLPVISSDIPALKSIVEGAGGLTFSSGPDDVTSLADAMAHYLALPPAARKAAGDTAYQYTCTHHDLDTYQSSYLQLIRHQLARRQR